MSTPKVSAQDKLCQDFLAVEPDERVFWLRSRTESERLALWQVLAAYPDLRATDVATLPQPYQAELCRFVCGDPQRGIGASGRAWAIEPTDKPVSFQVGTYQNRRRMMTIDKATHLQASLAINALVNYGPDAQIGINRGLLREVEPPKPTDTALPKPQGKGKATDKSEAHT